MSSNDKVLELQQLAASDSIAQGIAYKYNRYEQDRRPWLDEKLEIRQYLFATDTSMTTAGALPWRNKTVIPKLTQIRDNLQANYEMALFPNDDWLKWEAFSLDDNLKKKAEAIEAYMSTKLRDGGFRRVIRQCLTDYIDYGNAFATVEFINEQKTDPITGDLIPGYIGPKAVRVSPLDIVFENTSSSFEKTPKIVRKMRTLGQLKKDILEKPELGYYSDIIEKVEQTRALLSRYEYSDIDKSLGFVVDGFNSLGDYYNSPYVEILEFEGDIHDTRTGELLVDRSITIVDRLHVARNAPRKSWIPNTDYVHVGWRNRPDNLVGMGPLDNLVGMQYRIDHLENLKSDAMDLAVFPPLKIRGNVEEFIWGPGEEIDLGDDGEIEEMGRNLNGVITAENQIAMLEAKMEEMAGAPKQALGFRTPGEKTAYEVSQLENAASRIFQYKITQFETEFLEPLLNRMLEMAKRNMVATDVARTLDSDFGVQKFVEVSREDLTANGKIRPVGARHFAARSQLVQNLTGLFNSPVGQMIAPHTSAKQLAKLLEDTFGLNRFDIFRPNVAIAEQKETQALVQTAEDQLTAEGMTSTEDPNAQF